MSNILAGVGRGQLEVLGQRVEARRGVYDAYREGLAGIPGLAFQPEPEWSWSNRWLSALTLDPEVAGVTAAQVIQRLADEMIECRPVWKPMHLQPVFSHCRHFAHGNEPVSDRIFERGLCMPSGSNMTPAEIDRIIDAMRGALNAR
jgi:dTDP-4-amino-4,6-dideoxygalactose transaminase